jgi:hypothetical protein
MNRLIVVVMIAALGFCLLTSGCARKIPQPPAATTLSTVVDKAQAAAGTQIPNQQADKLPPPRKAEARSMNPDHVRLSQRNRAACFRLQPAKIVLSTSSAQPAFNAKRSTSRKARVVPSAGSTITAKPRKVVRRTVGLCQPQSLIYARCRTGITTCRLGDTSPVQWFACARKNSATTATPLAGSVIVIDTHKERKISTGHPAYVEEAVENRNGTWTLRISHTNYDRKCNLDLDAQVLFDPRAMTATFQTGPWSPWAHRLRVLGFILR